MPESRSQTAKRRSGAHNDDASQHDPFGFPAICQGANNGRKDAIAEQVQREHQCGITASPAKLIQNRMKKR